MEQRPLSSPRKLDPALPRPQPPPPSRGPSQCASRDAPRGPGPGRPASRAPPEQGSEHAAAAFPEQLARAPVPKPPGPQLGGGGPSTRPAARRHGVHVCRAAAVDFGAKFRRTKHCKRHGYPLTRVPGQRRAHATRDTRTRQTRQ